MGQIVTDNFNRANGGLGTDWTVRATGSDIGLDIVSQQCKASAATGEGIAWFSGPAWNNAIDQYAEAKIVAIEAGKDTAICVRMSASSSINTTANAYLLDINSTDSATPTFGTSINCSFYKQVNGVFTQIPAAGDFGVVINQNDVMRIEIQGTSLRAFQNGVQISVTRSDSSITTGNPGLYVGSGTGCIWDDFAAGDFGTVSKFIESPMRPGAFQPMGDAFRPAKYSSFR